MVCIWRGQKGCENKQQRVRGPTCPDRQREGLNVPGLSILGYIKSSLGLSLAIPPPPAVPLACLRKRGAFQRGRLLVRITITIVSRSLHAVRRLKSRKLPPREQPRNDSCFTCPAADQLKCVYLQSHRLASLSVVCIGADKRAARINNKGLGAQLVRTGKGRASMSRVCRS